MSSNQSALDVDDSHAVIPDSVRAWELDPRVVSSVRRPRTFPDPQTYHEAIEPQAIFELDEVQEDRSTHTILVVPAGCTRCRHTFKQACSRARPVCVRCRRIGMTACEAIDGGYHRLPGPKVGRYSSGAVQKCSVASSEKARELTVASDSPVSQEPVSGRLRVRPMRSTCDAGPLSQRTAPTTPGPHPGTLSGSKRSPSPAPDVVPPRKRGRPKGTTRRAKHDTVVERPEVSPIGLSAQPLQSTSDSIRWTFVNRVVEPSPEVTCIPSNTRIPRVWTNSLKGLLTVFPELAKSKFGFSWFQSETPILLLDTNYAQGRWNNPTTLNIDLLWDFSCHESALEPMDTTTRLRTPSPPRVYPQDPEADTTSSRISHLPPATESLPAYATVSACSLPIIAPSYDVPQDAHGMFHDPRSPEGYPYSHELESNGHLHVHSAPTCPTDTDCFSLSHRYAAPDGSPNRSPETSSRPRVPLGKPLEVETLSDSHVRFIPLLIWIAHDSDLVPCNLPPEYAYICMGLFFVSDLRSAVVSSNISPTGLVEGRVCWSVTLHWAPGGEDPLYDYASVPPSNEASGSTPVDGTRDLSRPWWISPTDISPPTQTVLSYYPRDLRMHFFSFIPLDLLAEFHPGESFPRGWFCRSCGMINVQVFFRHQICQSTMCKSMHGTNATPGKVDPLSSFRDPYQTSTVICPNNDIPSQVVSDSASWDDGMQTCVYNVKDGVVLCHVFTGNQAHLQEDATVLLERIQREVPLRKEDYSSPFFTHSTKLIHPIDGSEALVPKGTPNCVRAAYYTLCDMVHRYGEMDSPRFGEVDFLAWVNSGSRKGIVLHAAQSPAVIHCLGAEVVLKFIPKRGYGSNESAKGHDRAGSPPSAGPSCLPERDDHGHQTSFISRAETTDVWNTDEIAAAAMDTEQQCCTSGTSLVVDDVIKPPVRRKNKTVKGKNKTNVPEISITLVHGDCVVLFGDDFEYQIVRTGTTILVIGVPERYDGQDGRTQ